MSVPSSWAIRTMGPTLSPETSAFKLQTPEKNSQKNTNYSYRITLREGEDTENWKKKH